jgi:hypothetical protein
VTDVHELGSLVEDLRLELHAAVDELERSRAAHRQVESVLLGLLEHLPVPLVVVDGEERVRVASAAAESVWDVQLDAPVAGVPALRDLAGAMRAALHDGVQQQALPDGFDAAVLDEPGTDARYVVVWSTLAAAPGG